MKGQKPAAISKNAAKIILALKNEIFAEELLKVCSKISSAKEFRVKYLELDGGIYRKVQRDGTMVSYFTG